MTKSQVAFPKKRARASKDNLYFCATFARGVKEMTYRRFVAATSGFVS